MSILASFDSLDEILSLPLAVFGAASIPESKFQPSKHALFGLPVNLKLSVDARGSNLSADKATEILNCGIHQIIVSSATARDTIVSAGMPSDRFAVVWDDDIDAQLIASSAALVVSKPLDDFSSLSQSGNRTVYYSGDVSEQEAISLAQAGYTLICPASKLTLLESETDKISISAVFVSTLTTDRHDGLFTTLVTTPPPASSALGVVYSSKQSIIAAIAEQVGVFQLRKRPHELWYKGKTSGATQRLLSIEKDCDCDVVKFVVEPKAGYGFCHLDSNYTCFHDGSMKLSDKQSSALGLPKLDATLQQRFKDAPEGLYTKRLFNDEKLLIAKLKEELDELIEAGQSNDPKEVAWECADLLYFAMAWCVKHGVSLADVERNLDIKSLKITRRKGDAKPQYIEKDTAKEAPAKEAQPESPSYKMAVIDTTTPDGAAKVADALSRPVQKTSDIMKLVLPIIEKVKTDGDKALLELTAKFDGVTLDTPVLQAPFPPELMQISADMKEAIDLSVANIEKFHAAQMPAEEMMTVETMPGVQCSRFARPIENVGLYVPGGTAVLPSTAMMLGVPAKVAGCRNIILASPPARATGKLTPEVVYVAHKIGAKCIVMAGGAQAVTAMAYGTESVLKCDKILGPGNQFVTAAKMYVQNDTQALCSIDMPAGPSEVLVIADEKADADFVALDLLSQAEHGVDSQVILVGVGLSATKIAAFEEAIRRQAEKLPRKDIVAKCLAHSYTLLVDSYEKAFEMSNKYAPEHLILQIENAPSYVPGSIDNAGSVFVGALSPESCGDYSSGTNHTLPTYGYARQYSGVNTATFQKFITAQAVSEEGLKSIGKAVMTLAAVEGLEAHRYAVQVRMDKLGLL